MDNRGIGNRYAFAGIVFGAIALLLAVVHFWAGPFSGADPLEQTVATRIEGVRDAAIAALRGEEHRNDPGMLAGIDLDRTARIAAAVMAALAIVLAVVGFARGETRRAAGGALLLGGIALTFQYFVAALAFMFLAIVVSALITQLDGCCCCCD